MTDQPRYQPALDGIRGVAVVLVVLFHGGVTWLDGGYLGVSVFFTLSGFLITRLLLTEFDRTGGIDIPAFLARRARRLLPASAVCLVGVAVCSRLGLLDGVANLQRDLLGSAFQVQNWVMLASGDSYADLLVDTAGRPSPLDHYWSLAIEEQFYWFWPAAVSILAVVPHARIRRFGVLAFAAALVAPLTAVLWGAEAAYLATPARLAEILVGASLATMFHDAAALARRPPAWLGIAGWIGVASVMFGVLVLPVAGGFAYSGGLPLVAVASAFWIASVQAAGSLTRVMAHPVLATVGRASYGVYLYHWPIFVMLDESRIGLSGFGLLGLRLAVTAVVAAASFVWIEQPIRTATWRPRPTLAMAGGATVVLLVVAVAVPASLDEYWNRGTAEAASEFRSAAPDEPLTSATSPPTSAPHPPDVTSGVDGSDGIPPRPLSTAPSTVESDAVAQTATIDLDLDFVPARPVRIVMVGDSTAEATGNGLVDWAVQHPEFAEVALAVSPGCGFLRGGVVSTDDGVPFGESCDGVLDDVLPDLLEAEPDVVVLLATSRDMLDREWSDDEGPLGPHDPLFRARLEADYATMTRLIRQAGAVVVWTRAPDVDPFWLGLDDRFSNAERRAVVEGVMERLAADPGDGVELLDLRSWAADDGVDADHEARPDGMHWTPVAALDIADRYLAPALINIALDHT